MPDLGPQIAAIRAALGDSPENAKLREYLAVLLLEAGDAEDAAVQYRYLVERDERSVSARSGLAKALWKLGRDEEVAQLVDRLQDEPGCPPEATLLYARVKAKAGDLERAERAYRDAVAADPKIADAAFELTLESQARARPSSSARVPVEAAGTLTSAGIDPDLVEKPVIDFSDVGGMDGVKAAIRSKLIDALAHPEIYKAYGKSIGGGLLMYGPPGVGKTYLARATAGESKAAFINVGINDILNMWLGGSEHRLHGYFDAARKAAPCVLFFDEIDALGGNRQGFSNNTGRSLVSQFLTELDGVTFSNDGVFVVGATNAPWHLDSAFRRPGRFDRIIFVPPPDLAARAEIVRILLEGKPAEPVDCMEIARRTEHFSGADLKAVVDLAVEARLHEAVAQQIVKPISMRDLTTAAASIKPSTREWFSTAKNYALYSNEGGIYDDIVRYMRL